MKSKLHKVSIGSGWLLMFGFLLYCERFEPAEDPLLYTDTIVELSRDSYRFTGVILNTGKNGLSEHGFCWSTSEHPTFDLVTSTKEGSRDQNGTFTSTATGLEAQTKYYYRAYGISDGQTAYGEEGHFTTGEGLLTTTLEDIDGNTYGAVKIGNQFWMMENLKTTRYADGSPVLKTDSKLAWLALKDTSRSFCWPEDDAQKGNTLGALYTWHAAMNGAYTSPSNPSGVQGICPDGWHLPSDAEWKELETTLGMSAGALEDTLFRGNNQGGMLKDTSSVMWGSTNLGATNETGFSAVPAGSRSGKGNFMHEGEAAYFWSSTAEDPSEAWFRMLDAEQTGVGRNITQKKGALSVRCVRGAGTSPVPPAVSTSSISDIQRTSATGGGEVTNEGGAPVFERGICWSTSSPPTLQDSCTREGPGTGIFSSFLTELDPQTTYYVRAYATNSAGTGYGSEESFTTKEEAPDTIVDYDGNVYPVVQIGDQAWMAENLKTTHYADGSPIPHVEDDLEWELLGATGKGYCWHDHLTIRRDAYGGLYSWAAAVKGAGISPSNPVGIQGVCPDGWHLPSDVEWRMLEESLGLSQAESSDTLWRGLDEGGKLKETGTGKWNPPNTEATNETGFTARPGGQRAPDGTFDFPGLSGYVWTSSESDTARAWMRQLNYDKGGIFRNRDHKNFGYSVRCLEGEGSVLVKATISTANVSNPNPNSLTSGGTVSHDGGALVTARGVCWSTFENPTLADQHTVDGSGTGTFVSQIDGLDPGTLYYIRAYATNNQGTEYGNQVSFQTSAQAGTVTDYDGNEYATVQIGDQLWMAENLKVTRYSGGTGLTDGTGAGVVTGDQTTPYYFAHNDDPGRADTYGYLYTWAAAMNGVAGSDALPSGVQGVCPDNWHLPSDAEWQALETTLGMSVSDASAWNWRGTDEGDQLKTGGSSGFEGLLGGYRNHNGNSYDLGTLGYYWSTTDDGANVHIRQLGATSDQVRRFVTDKSNACSIRCVAD